MNHLDFTEDMLLRGYKTSRSSNHAKNKAQQQENEFSTTISWPIILAIIPTLGAFVAGSAEVWSDLIMILLILYYVYKWITVPWSYYESARTRRIIHQHHTDEKKGKRREQVEEELRKHEFVGLAWVALSPAIAGYTLQYSRYFLSNYDKYMSTFNVTVFVLAASLKPLLHIMVLLRERTLYLQSEMKVDESEVDILTKKMEIIQDELDNLRKAFATKKDLGQMAQGITPSIQQLTKAMKRFEKKEHALRSWSEDKFIEIDQKVNDFDQFICYSIEQEQRKSAQHFLVSLMLLPANIMLWAANRMTALLPIPRALLNITSTSTKLPAPSTGFTRPSKHLTDSVQRSSYRKESSEISYSGEESVPFMGHTSPN